MLLICVRVCVRACLLPVCRTCRGGTSLHTGQLHRLLGRAVVLLSTVGRSHSATAVFLWSARSHRRDKDNVPHFGPAERPPSSTGRRGACGSNGLASKCALDQRADLQSLATD